MLNSKSWFCSRLIQLVKEQTQLILKDSNINVMLDFDRNQLYIDFILPNQKIENYTRKDRMITLVKALDLCVYPYYRLEEQVPFVELIDINHRRLIFNLTVQELAI